jgi:single-stranded-DNA-specific exonuclease
VTRPAVLELDVRAFAHELGLTTTVARWLVERGHVEPEIARRFLAPRLSELTPPDAMVGRAAAARRLAEAVRQGERVVVFGDYDCDGITATAILTEALRSLGARVSPLLASRFEGGYGVSGPALQKVLELSPKLLVTCDCGSSDHESLGVLRSKGVDVVVIDHHLVPNEPLPALAFLNPHRPECGFPYKGLASCGLVLSVVAALRRELGATLDVRRWLDLVAIGTIADVAPLHGDNRALVRAGLRALAEAPRPGLAALLELAGVSRAGPLSARDVAFRVAPFLNAPGRMGAPTLALDLLLATDGAQARMLAGELSQITAQRREQQDEILAQATEEIETHRYMERGAIVVGRRGWNPGVVGIVAGKLAERYLVPVVVVGFEGDTGRGSVRGPEGSRLYDALSACAGGLRRYGGHQAAAGLELEEPQLAEFRERFVGAIASQERAPSQKTVATRLDLDEQDAPEQVLLDLDKLEPCDAANPRPQISALGKVSQAKEVGTSHLKLRLELGQWQLDCFAVNMAERMPKVGERVRVTGDLRRNTFRGTTSAELFVTELLPVGAP